MMCGGMGGMDGMGSSQNQTFGDLMMGILSFLGQLVSQFLIILTSGPVLGLLTVLVLILAIAALLRLLLTRRVVRRED